MPQSALVQLSNPPMRTNNKGKGKRVPVAVGIRRLVPCWIRMQSTPVLAVVGRDVRAVRADGDPGFGGWVVGYGGAVAVRGVVASSP